MMHTNVIRDGVDLYLLHERLNGMAMMMIVDLMGNSEDDMVRVTRMIGKVCEVLKVQE